jgi:hypothetical protein
MAVLFRLMFAFSFELKSGRIKSDVLKSRLTGIVEAMARRAGREAEAPSNFMIARERYPQIDLADSIISDQVLIDILVKGIVDDESIRSCLDNSRYFITASDEPVWRTVWHWLERTDDQIAKAYDKMERQFTAREFLSAGEILHVFGLRLFASNVGLLKKSRADVVVEGKQYIDDLYAKKRLDGLPNDFDEVRSGGYGGLGIHENTTAEYRELFAYLETKGKKAVDDKYPEKGLALLKEMESDPRLFFRRVSLTNSQDNWYYDVPILASVDADVFVSSLLKLHPAQQRIIMMALHSRYEHGKLDRDLPSEKSWLVSVTQKLLDKAAKMTPIGKYRLLKNIDWHLTPVLKVEDKS